ncbi:MAG: hypothetical protein ACKV2T_38740 [Kofleriaceae bacterium]
MSAQALLAAHTDLETLASADRAQVVKMQKAAGPNEALVEVPLQTSDVHDVERLIALEHYLLA